MTLRLLGRSNSINVQKVLWCGSELALPMERENVGGEFGYPEGYERLNPSRRVPTLIDGELAVWESNTVLRYLASRYDQRSSDEHLYGQALGARCSVDTWLDWQATTLADPLRTLFLALVRNRGKAQDAGTVELAQVELSKQWAMVDRQLASTKYVAGEHVTLADIALGVCAYRWYALPIDRPTLPNLARWHGQLAARTGFRQHVALPLS